MSWNFTQAQGYQQQQQQYFQQNHPQYSQQQQYCQSQHYGNYGEHMRKNVFEMRAWEAYNMGTEAELSALFAHHVNKSESNCRASGIQSEDLCELLNQTPSIKNYYGITWSREMCSVLMAMLDRNPDGFMQWPEFMELQRCLLAWHNMFKQCDLDRSGYIESTELSGVIQKFGYRIKPHVFTTLLKRFSRVHTVNGQDKTLIAFDDFVTLSVRLRAYTDAFRKRDRLQHGGQETGCTQFDYDDFLACVMCL